MSASSAITAHTSPRRQRSPSIHHSKAASGSSSDRARSVSSSSSSAAAAGTAPTAAALSYLDLSLQLEATIGMAGLPSPVKVLAEGEKPPERRGVDHPDARDTSTADFGSLSTC